MLLEAVRSVSFSNSAGSTKVKPFVFPLNREESVSLLCDSDFRVQTNRKNVRPSVLLKPTNPQPIKWFRPCWKACWSRFLPHWLPWLQACHSSHCWYIWYLSITSKIYLCPFGLVFCLFCSLYDLGYFPFAILIGFSVFGLVGTDFQVVYVDGCLCISNWLVSWNQFLTFSFLLCHAGYEAPLLRYDKFRYSWFLCIA